MKVSVRLDDISPLIQYDGEWITGDASADSEADKYSDGGTFKVTKTNEGKATISWAGTQITVFGAKRFNHKEYTVTLDDNTPQTFDGGSDDAIFQTSLYQSPLVPNGPHQLLVQDSSTDPNRPFLDIDFVVIESEVDGSQSVNVEDDDPSWSFAPSNAWSSDPTQFTQYSGGTGHSTRMASATATLQFEGTAIDLYGLICDQCGGYWVSIDDGQKIPLNSHNDDWTKPQSLLYMGRGLSEGKHSLTVTNFGMKGAGLSIDYAKVYGSQPRGIVGAVNPSPSPSALNESKSNGTSSVAIILAVIIPLIIVILGLILVLLLRQRRIWPFNTPISDEESIRAGNQSLMRNASPNDVAGRGASPYPGPFDPRTLDIDGSPPVPMLAVPTAPVSMYNAQMSDPAYAYARQPVAQVGPASYLPGITPYDGMLLPTYRESVYEQSSIGTGSPRPPEKGRYRRG